MPDFTNLYNNSPQQIFQDMIDDIINVEERASNRRRNLFGGLVGNLMTLEEII